MRTTFVRPLALGLVVSGLAIVPGAAAAPPDLEATAKTLVNQCANLKQGDLVLITGTPKDTELLENIAVNVRKLGAFPLISIESDRLVKRIITEVPATFDTQTPEFNLKLANIVNATIAVDRTENPALLAGISPARITAWQKARMAVENASLKHNVHSVALGNGLFPTEATAELYGLSTEKLSTIFWDGVNTDYNKLQATGDAVKRTIKAGKEVRLTNPNGTDITFNIESRPVFVSDGVISPEDASTGGPACQVWLPAGEVYVAPVSGTAEGKVVIDRQIFQGKEITGLTLVFRNGKVTEMTARSGIEPLKALYDAAPAGKENFAFFDIGINQSMTIPQGSKLLAWMPAGMVSIGWGNNTWAGGSNDSPFSASGFIPGSTLTIDGKALVEKGTLKQ